MVGRRQTRDSGHAIEDLFEREIFAAKDVALTRDAAIERDQMHAGDFGDVDKVKAGIDVGRKFFIEEVDDDAASGCGFGVVPNRSALSG